MKISVDISYYPLKEEYKAPIKNFIKALEENDKITVKTNRMSTQVFGPFDETMEVVTKCIKDAFELPESIFILKIINMDRE
ncbi:MAG: thiamine-binding protein [Fermentimonas sp.]|nr:thiamine-binding protein [Fermentimonas sp.]